MIEENGKAKKGERVWINQRVKPETRNMLLIMKVRMGKRTIGEVIDEVVKAGVKRNNV